VAETVHSARGDAGRLASIFESSPVPMLLMDNDRNFVDANRPARLAFRIDLEEMRRHTTDDLTPQEGRPGMVVAWERMLDAGSVAGKYEVVSLDGSHLVVVYFALANALPGRHLAVFAPDGWSPDELGSTDELQVREDAQLTPREREVLQLSADGLSGPGIAEKLKVSPATVKTHFRNIYEKLGVSGRVAAVVKGLRLGLIE
jgi:DNA-binding CsgD family transcriptional regulator